MIGVLVVVLAVIALMWTPSPTEASAAQTSTQAPATRPEPPLKTSKPQFLAASDNTYSGVVTTAVKVDQPITVTIWIGKQKPLIRAAKAGTYQTTIYNTPKGETTWRACNGQETAAGISKFDKTPTNKLAAIFTPKAQIRQQFI